MNYAGFASLRDAAIYRHNHGGWLWVDEYCCAVWFDAAEYTPSRIFAHPVVNLVAPCAQRGSAISLCPKPKNPIRVYSLANTSFTITPLESHLDGVGTDYRSWLPL